MRLSEELTAVLAFVFAFASATVAVPAAIRLAWGLALLDSPLGYKRHSKPTPYLGGAAVIVATVPAALLVGGLDYTVAWALGGALLMAVVGTIDDRRTLGPLVRLAIEIALALALWADGLGWSAFNNEVASALLTVVWVVGLVNAFNLMDNLDGATGTLGMVCAAGAGVVAFGYGSPASAALGFALSGACAGFLIFNLRRPSAVFLGDGGSMPIGFVIAVLLMAITRNVGGFGAAAVVAVAPLVGLSILDTTLIMVSRLRRGVPLLSGGRDHLTHRLLGLLGTPQRVALALAVVQAGLCALGLVLLSSAQVVVIAVGIAYITLGSLAIMALDLRPRFRPAEDHLAPPVLADPVRQESAP